MSIDTNSEFKPLAIALLTVSDTRGVAEDSSGQFLENSIIEAGHRLIARRILPDDVYLVRALMSSWIADPDVNAVIITGGTGFYERDSTPEAVIPLFQKTIDGFGEEFRRLSAAEIGSSTIQSRAFGGLANHTIIFCLPGSTGACRTGWNGILSSQLDSRHRPCNFSGLVLGKQERPMDRINQVIGERSER